MTDLRLAEDWLGPSSDGLNTRGSRLRPNGLKSSSTGGFTGDILPAGAQDLTMELAEDRRAPLTVAPRKSRKRWEPWEPQ